MDIYLLILKNSSVDRALDLLFNGRLVWLWVYSPKITSSSYLRIIGDFIYLLTSRPLEVRGTMTPKIIKNIYLLYRVQIL